MAYMENFKKMGNEDEEDVRDQGTNVPKLMNLTFLDTLLKIFRTKTCMKHQKIHYAKINNTISFFIAKGYS